MTKLIFCCGCDRSGTTLLSREIGNVIKNSFVLPEAYFFHQLRCVDLETLENNLEFFLLHNPRYLIWGKGNLKPTVDFGSYESLFIGLVKANFDVPKSVEVIIDSTPISYLWKLNSNFENSQYIHIRRDVRSVAASLLSKDWGPMHAGKAIDYWCERVSLAKQLSDFEISYENLISFDENTIEDLNTYLYSLSLELDWDNFNRPINLAELPKFTRKQHKLLGKPIDKSKASIKTSDAISYYYSNNMLACELNNDLVSFRRSKNLKIKIIELFKSIIREVKSKLN